MRQLTLYLYNHEPLFISADYSIVLRPAIHCLGTISLILMLPWGVVLFCVPALLYCAIALASYSAVFRAYYKNRVMYWLFAVFVLCIAVFVFRPIVHYAAAMLIDWS